jgi:hypothetical protein
MNFVRIGLVPTGHRFGVLELQSCGAWGQAPSLLNAAPPECRSFPTVVLLCPDRACPDRTPLWRSRASNIFFESSLLWSSCLDPIHEL